LDVANVENVTYSLASSRALRPALSINYEHFSILCSCIHDFNTKFDNFESSYNLTLSKSSQLPKHLLEIPTILTRIMLLGNSNRWLNLREIQINSLSGGGSRDVPPFLTLFRGGGPQSIPPFYVIPASVFAV
jgi:hypothetical protein